MAREAATNRAIALARVRATRNRHLINTYIPYRNLEDARIPLHVVATDLLSGGTVVLSRGPLAQAIIASTAIPAAFAPVSFERMYLADGCNHLQHTD